MKAYVRIKCRCDGNWRWVKHPSGNKRIFPEADAARAFHDDLKQRGIIDDFDVVDKAKK